MSESSLAAARTRLYGLAAGFVLPGLGPDVDEAISLACDLIVLGLDTPATVDVAALGARTALREAGPLIRDMLTEQHIPVAEPDAGQAEAFAVVLRAFARGAIPAGEFAAAFYDAVPAWPGQTAAERRLVVLLGVWENQTAPARREQITAQLRELAAAVADSS